MYRLLMTIISVLTLVPPLAVHADTEAGRWLWTTTQSREEARHLALTVTPLEADSQAGVAPFQCAIRSDFGYRGAEVTLEVRGDNGALVSEGSLPLHIDAGANECTVTLDTSELPLGSYTATFAIAHPLLLSEPTHTLSLRNVSSRNLREQLDAAEARARELVSALDTPEAGGMPHPYLRVKSSIIADVLQQAREDADRGAWESVEAHLRYASEGLDAVHAGMVFGHSAPERADALPPRTLGEMYIEDGAFMVDGAPVFLFGGALPDMDPAALERLERYHLNAATVTLRPSENPADDRSQDGIRASLDPLFTAAKAANVSLAVQLLPEAIAPADTADTAAAPALSGVDRRGHLGDTDARTAWVAYLEKVGPLLRDESMLLGVSLARHPRFRFDGAETKAGFLEFIRHHYEDRLALNRAWRSHLAHLENIELWSENPYDTYQEHRAFRFDWQTFHQSLGNDYLRWSRDQARARLGDVPLMATLPDTPFQTGESVYGIDREKLAAAMDISACSGANAAEDPVYATEHPHQAAHYALLRSFAPEQPVFNLNNTWTLPEAASNQDAFRFVHSGLWEGVMAGLSGATIPVDSLVFQRPAALEGLATAALDVNRLAPIVHAFQTAPIDVGILFSESSRVFDSGDPHLHSALNAYEGASFGGYNVRFITETQCLDGVPAGVKILVIPDTPALNEQTFQHLRAYVEDGGTIARTGAPIPYNERGFSRDDLIPNTGNTVLVRGLNLPTEYLHAMDAASVLGALPQIPRAITGQGYPVEGVRSRFVEFEGGQYLYIVNLRKEPVYCTLATQTRNGRDLINGQDVTFPTTLDPLVPMLIKLDPVRLEMTVTATNEPSDP